MFTTTFTHNNINGFKDLENRSTVPVDCGISPINIKVLFTVHKKNVGMEYFLKIELNLMLYLMQCLFGLVTYIVTNVEYRQALVHWKIITSHIE